MDPSETKPSDYIKREMGDHRMKKFKVSAQIGFYSQPYEYHTVWAWDKKDALARVDSMLPKYVGHRFLNVVVV